MRVLKCLYLMAPGALLGLKPSRIFHLVNVHCAPRRAAAIHPHPLGAVMGAITFLVHKSHVHQRSSGE